MSIVPTIDLRTSLCPVRHQGSRMTCLAFVLSEMNRFYGNGPQPLSPEYLYASAAYITPGWRPYDGLLLREGLTATASPGQPLDVVCPYTLNEPSIPLSAPANHSPMHVNKFQVRPLSQVSVSSELTSGRPVGLGLNVTYEFAMCDQHVVPFSACALPKNRHSVMVVGEGTDSATSELHFLVRNSWGLTWGFEGHAWLSETYFNTHGLVVFGV